MALRQARAGPCEPTASTERDNAVRGDGNWCRAYALALHGKPVTFLGSYAAVAVVRNQDDSFTADTTRPTGETDIRAYPAAVKTWWS